VRRGWAIAWRGPLFGLFAGVLAACSTTAIEPLLAPKAVMWDVWTAHVSSATATVDHGAWDRLLKTYLVRNRDGVNRFAYGRVNPADRQALNAYIARLTATPIAHFNRDEQLAYWINLYNALTVKVILEYYPVASIRDIDLTPGLLSDGPWDRKLIKIGKHAVSLNDIEHRILRPIWLDPRIHYAVNCASIGCPNLQPDAFTAANAKALLNQAAVEYVNDPRGVRVLNNKLVISKIYLWFAEDFGSTPDNIFAHLRRYARPELAQHIRLDTEIAGYEYDWALNDAR
jgi:hypothetical protein